MGIRLSTKLRWITNYDSRSFLLDGRIGVLMFDFLIAIVEEVIADLLVPRAARIVTDAVSGWMKSRLLPGHEAIPMHVRGRGGSRMRRAHAELCSAAIRGSSRRWFPCGERE